jgi:hypothetical protein
LSHTFDVRFAPSAGLGALLAQPSNTLRWKGTGRISIQPDAVTIAVNRGWLSWGRSRRIAAGALREVYREGESLRLEFSGPDNTREFLPLWARDRDDAAQIVRLLPTTRTVEVEQSASGKHAPRFRPDPRAFGVLLAMIVLIVAAVIGMQRSKIQSRPAVAESAPELAIDTASTDARTPPELATIEFPDPALLQINIDDPAVPIPKGTRAYQAARMQIMQFEREAAALLDEYKTYRTQREADVLTTDEYLKKLRDSIEAGWWKVTFRILGDPVFDDPALVGLRASQLAAARNWRAFIALYSEGQIENSQVLISRSFAMLERAEAMERRARLYAE